MNLLIGFAFLLSYGNVEVKDYYVCFSPNCSKDIIRFNNINQFKSHLVKSHACKNIDKSQMKFGEFILKEKDKFDHPYVISNKKSFFACITPDIDVQRLVGMITQMSTARRITMDSSDKSTAINTMSKEQPTMTLRDMTTGNTAGKKLPNVMYGGNLKYPIYSKNR